MLHISSVNKELQLDVENLESLTEELAERDEFLCTANACGADVTGI